MSIGIYILIFDNTDKIYIGKSVSLETRLSSHLWSMRNNQAAKKLQQAYNTFGAPKLEILTTCSLESIWDLERFYIAEFDAINIGFNHSPGGESGNVSPGELNGRALGTNEQYIEALELLVTTILTVEEIATHTKLSKSSVQHISAGENHLWLKEAQAELYEKLLQQKKFHKNKILMNSKRKYNVIVSPTGQEYNLNQVLLSEFCGKHNLTESHVSSVLNGRSIQHKGWHTGKFTFAEKRKPVIVISPDNKEFVVEYGTYSEFARVHKMDPGAFRKVVGGTAKSHHGWKLKV
jgi:predicted DNA-binding protein YlxM (UPF0122 family)